MKKQVITFVNRELKSGYYVVIHMKDGAIIRGIVRLYYCDHYDITYPIIYSYISDIDSVEEIDIEEHDVDFINIIATDI